MSTRAAESTKAERDAATTVMRAQTDPMTVALENAQLRSSIQGAYALLHALVRRLGGDVSIPVEQIRRASSPLEKLVIERDAEDNARVYIDSPGRAKPKGKRAA